MKVFIAYATTDGQTFKIAEWIGDWVKNKGHEVCLVDVSLTDEHTGIAGFDLYILAGSIHMKKHQPELEHFVKRHLLVLDAAPNAFISVSASAARKDPESRAGVEKCLREFIERTGWTPNVCEPVAGAIKYTKYNFIVRAIMKRISAQNHGPTDTSRDHELTDWPALDRFLDTLFDSKLELQEKARRSVVALNDKNLSSEQVILSR